MFLIVLTFVIGVFLNVLSVAGYQPRLTNDAIILDAKSYGASCSTIKYDPDSKIKASISLQIEELEPEGNYNSKEIKIPVIIFRYKDILNFTSIPPIEEYFYDYAHFHESGSPKEREKFLKNVVDYRKNTFILQLSEGHKLDEDKIFNDYITVDTNDKHLRKAILPVYESGIYCAYIAPPMDVGIRKLAIPVTYQNSTGYLPYIQYLVYTQLKYVIALGLILAGYLFHYILNFKIGDNFKNMDSISVISKAIIFYLLMPFVMLSIAHWFTLLVQNSYISSGRHAPLFREFRLTLMWVSVNFSILIRFFILLFAMGYGVVYYHNDNHKNYREIPKKLINKAVTLLAINIFLFTLSVFFSIFGENIQTIMHGDILSGQIGNLNSKSNYDATFIIRRLVEFAYGVFPFVWFVISLTHYFKTKKIIAKFPPIAADSEGSVIANERIIKSFRQSILIIFVLPAFLLSVLVAFMAYHFVHSPLANLEEFDSSGNERKAIYDLVKLIKVIEFLSFDKLTVLPAFWTDVLNTYLVIILLYVIWIKNNNSLVMNYGNDECLSSGAINLAYESDSNDLTNE